MTTLMLSRMHFPVTTLGPGRRIGLWVQGCTIRCPGCISMDTWASGTDPVSIGQIGGALRGWLDRADGITITGGEPLEQEEAIVELLRDVRAALSGDVLVYTGLGADEALARPLATSGLVDAMIPEPFRPGQPRTRALRGSDNQPLVPLTALGRERYEPFIDAPPELALDAMFDTSGGTPLWLAGIPNGADFLDLVAGLEAEGHRVTVTADQRYRSERFDD
ncbi:MAG: 4Fe-4S cluster-binding domain-containing protein [Pseudomonadota bacterium]